jgi:hypothetical protein
VDFAAAAILKGVLEETKPMGRFQGRWHGAWCSESWASARAVWKKVSPDEAAKDVACWHDACEDQGDFMHVLWCELRQLLGDVLPPEMAERVRGPIRR